MRGGATAVRAGLAALALAACGPGSGSAPASPPYGAEGPSSVAELEACLAAQPDERRLVRSTVNGSLSADIRLVGQGAPTVPLVNTALLDNGMVDGKPAAAEIEERTEPMGNALAFEPYRSGAFAVYPTPRIASLREFQATVDACLPVTSTGL